jgi:hypothetical protein
MASTMDTESLADDCIISPRDAVRREALKYFSSDPGRDSLANNIGLHHQARKVLSTEPMTVEELSRVSLSIFCRNALNDVTQAYLQTMEVKPICEFSEYDSPLAIGKELLDLGDRTGLTHVVHKADLFMCGRHGGFRPYNKPVNFLEQSILAAGILPGEALDKKLAMAKSIKDEETSLYGNVSAELSRLGDGLPGTYVQDHFDLLLLCCGMSREFEYEKREICGKLYYYSDANKRAYDILEAIGVQPFYLFEAFGSYEWSLHNRAKDLSERGLSLLEGICPSETALDRKVQRYVVCHFLFLNASPVKDFAFLKKAVERECNSAESAEGLSA